MNLLPIVLSMLLSVSPAVQALTGETVDCLSRESSVLRLEETCDPALRLIAHRGLSVLAPENSRPALELAAGYGMAGCEFDVYPTADGVWVLSHDPTVDRMTDGSGAIAEMTYEQLSRLRVDAGCNVGQYPGLALCTLAEALDVCAEGGVTPYIDIKTGTPAQLDSLVDLLRQKQMLEQSVILSYGYDILQYLRTGGDVIPLYLLVSHIDDAAIQQALSLPNTGLDFWLTDGANTPEAIGKAQAAGIPLIAWATDRPEVVESLNLLGVTHITTNRLVSPIDSVTDLS